MFSLVYRSVLRYIVHVLHRFWLQSARSRCHVKRHLAVLATSSPGLFPQKWVAFRTKNSVMETKVPDFVSTMSRTIKCNHCNKLFVNQQGLSAHEKCLHGFQNLSLGFILKIFLKFRKFQPRYSYKIYSYKKKSVPETTGSHA